ncbi:MAG: hypothetical protein IKP77_03145 [Acholeplasmatales bacterium]|nr:hypothetical protein [Acholeplasmatales bacterium]
MATEKIITSHAFRVKRAKEYVKNSPDKISIFDREAIVEFYLLEDVVELFEYRYNNESKKTATTRGGEMAHQRNLKRYELLTKLYTQTAEIARALIDSGEYKIVWKSIPEGNLMKAAKSIKNVAIVKEIGIDLLKELSDEALELERMSIEVEEQLDDLERHESNVRLVRGIPTQEEISNLISEVEAVMPSKDKKINLN